MLSQIRNLFPALPLPGIIRERQGNCGEVRIDLLLDTLGHIRAAINDDEIIDRATDVGAFTRQPLWFITYDVNQSLRARAAEIQTTWIPMAGSGTVVIRPT